MCRDPGHGRPAQPGLRRNVFSVRRRLLQDAIVMAPEYSAPFWRDPADPDRLIGAKRRVPAQMLAAGSGRPSMLASGRPAQEEAAASQHRPRRGLHTPPRLIAWTTCIRPSSRPAGGSGPRSPTTRAKEVGRPKGLQGVTVINNSFGEDFDKFAKQSLKISTVARPDQACHAFEKAGPVPGSTKTSRAGPIVGQRRSRA